MATGTSLYASYACCSSCSTSSSHSAVSEACCSPQVFQQLGHALRFLRALIHAQRCFRTGNGALQPRNLFLDKAAALLHLAQLDGIHAGAP